MSFKIYSIVEYTDSKRGTKPVEIVPTIWINFKQGIVFWPPKPLLKDISDLVKKADTNPGKNWKVHSFERILGQYSDYNVAVEKLEKSLYTSNLESDCDSSPVTHTKRPSKYRNTSRRDSSSSSDDNCIRGKLPPPPSFRPIQELNQQDLSSGLDHQDENRERLPPKPSTSEHLSQPTLVYVAHITGGEGTNEAQTKQLLDADKDPLSSPSSVNLESASLPADEAEGGSILNLSLSSDQIGDPSLTIASTADLLVLKQFMKEFASKVFTQLETLSAEIREVKQFLYSTRPAGAYSLPDFSKLPEIPIESKSKLEEFENWLGDASHQELLGDYIATIGGKTVEKTVRNVLKRLIAPELSCQINFTGKGDKTALKHLKLLLTLKDGIRKGDHQAQEDAIEKAAIDWFRFSKNRLSNAHGRRTN